MVCNAKKPKLTGKLTALPQLNFRRGVRGMEVRGGEGRGGGTVYLLLANKMSDLI